MTTAAFRRPETTGRWLGTAAALAVVVATAVVVQTHWTWTFDTLVLLRGAGGVFRCIADGSFVNCAGPGSEIGKYPVAQYVPALALHSVGIGGSQALHALTLLNTACFAGVVTLMWYVPRRLGHPVLSPVLVLAVVSSPLVMYATAAFSEMLASFLTVLFVAAVAERRPMLIGVSLTAAGATKETALPFLLLLACAVLVPSLGRIPKEERFRIGIAILIGSAAALAVNAGFNVMRYGGPLNEGYSTDQPAPLSYWPLYFGSSLIAPNVGVLLQWPLAVGLVAGVATTWRRALPLLTLLALLAFYAAYFSPWGSIAWSNRYAIAWIPAILLAAVCGSPGAADRLVRRVAERLVPLLAVIGVCMFVAWSNFAAVTVGQKRSFGWSFAPDATCPLPASIPQFSKEAARCRLHSGWRGPVVLQAARSGIKRDALPYTLVALLAVGALGVSARRLSRAPAATEARV